MLFPLLTTLSRESIRLAPNDKAGWPQALPSSPVTPEELVAAVSPAFGRVGSAWYFVPETVAAGRELGLGARRFYFLGRGGALGDVDWRVVASAFGYFAPALVEEVWTSSRERCEPAVAAAAFAGACADFGRRTLGGVGGLDAFCAAAERVVDAAVADAGGLTLFAGYAALPLADDLPGRAAQLVAVLRELRGSAHLSAVVATGLPTPLAHAIRRPADGELFGWAEGQLPLPTDDDRRLLAAADAATDRVLARRYAPLDNGGREALRAGAAAIGAAVAAA